MIGVIVAFAAALLASLFGTPVLIKFLVKKQYGQFIRQDGPTAHFTKRGTPTMGGIVISIAVLVGIFIGFAFNGSLPTYSVWLLILLTTGLGFVGFLDDFIKIRNHRSLGLNPIGKIIGQVGIATLFGALLLLNPNSLGRTPGSTEISIVRGVSLNLAFAGVVFGVILFLLWINFLVAAWSNGVNLTDGLDGLATGASIGAFAAYVIISFWQYSQACSRHTGGMNVCYETRDPLGLAIFAAAVVGSLIGFLWWNSSPAQIFMGDTGSLALGGAFAGLSIMSHTELIAAIIGGLFVVIVLSDVIQIGSFKATGKRVFKMAPLHHHFELSGWKEVTIVTRFWIISALFAALGVGLFYLEWVSGLQ